MPAPEKLEPADALPLWRAFVGGLAEPGCYVLHRTCTMTDLMQKHPSEVIASLFDEQSRARVKRSVLAELDDTVDRALSTSRVFAVDQWLRHWWLEAAPRDEVIAVASLASKARRGSWDDVRVEASQCPALVNVLALRHDTRRIAEQKLLRINRALLQTAIGLAIDRAWYEAWIGSEERRALLGVLGKPVAVPEVHIEWDTHWWTGKGEQSRPRRS